jgi:hypothetical protein
MAKKSSKKMPAEKSAADYYKLKTSAVDRLVSTKKAPEVTDEEIRKYTSRGKFRIPAWLKVVFVKFWFAGAICYFFLWGLGLYIQGLDLMAVLSIGLGVANDLMVNKLLRNFEPTERAYDKWQMVTVRKYWSIFINVIYSGVVLFLVFQIYYAVNSLAGVNASADPTQAQAMLGVEPMLFGILYMAVDLLLVKIKNTFANILRDAGAFSPRTAEKK